MNKVLNSRIYNTLLPPYSLTGITLQRLFLNLKFIFIGYRFVSICPKRTLKQYLLQDLNYTIAI